MCRTSALRPVSRPVSSGLSKSARQAEARAGTRAIYRTKSKRKKQTESRHSPFDRRHDSIGFAGTLAIERTRIAASSSDASGNVLRPILPQLGPSGHLAVYQSVYYSALAYFTRSSPRDCRRLHNAASRFLSRTRDISSLPRSYHDESCFLSGVLIDWWGPLSSRHVRAWRHATMDRHSSRFS
jgi:hypothetical protein